MTSRQSKIARAKARGLAPLCDNLTLARVMARRQTSARGQSGFSIVEVMVIIGIMALFASIYMVSTSTDSSKATALLSSMQTASDSLERLKMDAGCFPVDPEALWTKSAATSSNMWCGEDATNSWDGPYMKPVPFDTTNQALESYNVGSAVEVTFTRETGGSNGYYYYLHAANLPTGVVEAALLKCNGSKTATTTFDDSKCRGTTSGTSTASGTFDLLVEDAAS